MFSLKNKNTFITGGASGIGLAVARHFIDNGARVVVADIQDGETSGIDALFIQADAGDEIQVASALDRAEETLGKLDVVINNAGIVENTYESIEDKNPEELDRLFRVNTFGVYWGLKHAPGHMNDGGAIINTASLAAMFNFPYYSVYAATKAGVISLTRSAAIELGARNIRVNAVCPGTVSTPMQPKDDPEAMMCKTGTPLGRIAVTDDLVGVYHFLAADASRYVNGQALIVDGGWTCGASRDMWEKFSE